MGVTHAPPRAVVAAFAEGLELLARGYGGRGLRVETVRDAVAIRDGARVSTAKLRRMVAWHARHGASVQEVAARRRNTPAHVAWLLWGGSAGERWARRLTGAE